MGTTPTDEEQGIPQRLPGATLLRPGIMNPREYQLNIVKDAVEKNTLVVLPTGLGKTLISVLAAAQLLERNCDMKVLIMAPTKPLVLQHKTSFGKILNIDEEELIQMTGEVTPTLRMEQWSQGRIFFTTPQVVENDIAKGRLTLKDFCLVVFDEAHRAVKDYAYTAIAKHYMGTGVYPLLLGLTASPGGNSERVLEVCQALSIEKIIYRTHEDEDVSPYVHEIETEWREVELPAQYEPILGLLRRMVEIRVDKLRGFLPTDGAGGSNQYIGKRLLLTLGDRLREKLDKTPGPQRGPIFGYMMLQSSALSLLHAMELLESQGIRSLMRFLNHLEDEKDEKKAYKNIINDAMYPEMYKTVVDNLEVEHPKVEQLKLEIVKQYSKDKNAKILVFTQYRDSAALLSSAIRNDVFVVERFVGQASKLGDKGMDQEAQKEILDRFRNGEITVLVATSVAEEGLDIPDVDLVIFYEPIPSEIRFIQRKGRTGRSRVGKVVLLATQDSIDTAFYQASQRKIKRMREIMLSINTTLDLVQRGPRPPPTPIGTKPRPMIAEQRPSMPSTASTRPKVETKVHVSPMGPTATSEARLVREWVLETLEHKDEAYIEDLFERGSEEGMARGDMFKALEDLRKEGAVFKPRWDLVRKVKARKEDTKGQLEVTVLKVTQGCAQLLIDGETEALLEPEEFPGNLALIKKGKKFRVHGELYSSGGKKHLRVLDVVE